MLEGLNAISWHTLGHAYGWAHEVPVWIRQLTSTEKRVRQNAISDLGGSICHQGFNCETTVYVVPFLIELLQEPSVQGKEDILDLLWGIHADEETPIEDAQAAVAAHFSLYLTFLDDPDIAIRMVTLALLSSFKERRSEVSPLLKGLLKQHLEPREQANLILALGEVLEPTEEEVQFLLEYTQSLEYDLVTFAAALTLPPLAKKKTPQEIVQYLTRIAHNAPVTFDDFIDLPLGSGPQGAARRALSHLTL